MKERPSHMIGMVLGFAVALGVGGCTRRAEPMPDLSSDPPALRTIRREYEALVAAAWENPDLQWHTGGVGNIIVNVFKGNNRGLCFEWQEYLYLGLLPTVRRVGWDMTGIAVNENKEHEHHCVLVWDPREVRGRDVLIDATARPVYVLDVWRTGTPHVYLIDEWLRGEEPHEAAARIQPLPEPSAPKGTPGRWEEPGPNASGDPARARGARGR